QSTHFCELFNASNDDEYAIDNVSYQDMQLFLSLIYPQTEADHYKTVVTNVRELEKLLALAEYFNCAPLKTMAERFLTGEVEIRGISTNARLLLADKYKYSKPLSKILQTLQTRSQFKKLRDSEEFGQLSDTLRSHLLEIVIDKMPPSRGRPKMKRVASRTGRLNAYSDIEIDDDSNTPDSDNSTPASPSQSFNSIAFQRPMIKTATRRLG
ncbi:hypothetical protein PFISCL1PPCAC_19451, partial [Pristionchus fissidentatus]